MSGIAGIFNRNGRAVEIQTLSAMLAAVDYRGPHGSGRWCEGNLGIGQQMLHSTPEAMAEQQPWSDEAGRYRLVFDGRIDNRHGLRSELSKAGFGLRNDTDAELVLRSYQCWGERFAAKLIGDFAIVIWDSQTQALLCARDPTGMRPLYYYIDASRFVCGSELHQLFCCQIPCEPDEAIAGEYLANRPFSAEATLYRSIRQLLPAHILIVSCDHLVIRRYYDVDCDHELRYRSDGEYADHFLSLFKEAVRCRLRAVGLIALDLSGGLDSSSIVSVSRMLQEHGECAGNQLESFSQVFPGLACDESEFIKAVSGKCGVRFNLESPTPADQIDLAAQVRRFRDFPHSPNFTSGLGFRLLQRARGARASITGEGGDEWFGGTFLDNADLLRSLRIAQLIRQLQIDSRQSATRLMRHVGWVRLLIATALIPLLPPALREIAQWKARGRIPYPPWINPDFARRIDLYARLIAEPGFPQRRGVGRRLLYETFHNGEITLSNLMAEQGRARIGLETRQPFFDRRLIEFACALPNDQMRRDGLERYVVRNAMRGILPEMIRTRITKADFNQPVMESVIHNAQLISFDRMEIAERGWIDAAKLKAGFQALVGSYHNGAGNYAFPVWMAIATEIWHRVVFGSGKLER
jgi:asparagine synthase (glutamine-hydrolysing)